MSFIVFLPAAVALILAFFPKSTDANVFRYVTLAATIGVLAMVVGAFFFPGNLYFDASNPNLQNVELFPWISSQAFSIDYFMGIDGISFPLIVLTAGVSVSFPGAGIDNVIGGSADPWTGGFVNVVLNF